MTKTTYKKVYWLIVSESDSIIIMVGTMRAGRQAGRQADRQVQADRQAGRQVQADRQAGIHLIFQKPLYWDGNMSLVHETGLSLGHETGLGLGLLQFAHHCGRTG